jgi:hypothetical protein
VPRRGRSLLSRVESVAGGGVGFLGRRRASPIGYQGYRARLHTLHKATVGTDRGRPSVRGAQPSCHRAGCHRASCRRFAVPAYPGESGACSDRWLSRCTFSLPSSCNKVDVGRWSRSHAYEGLLRSMQGDAVAALCCCSLLERVPRPASGQRNTLPRTSRSSGTLSNVRT